MAKDKETLLRKFSENWKGKQAQDAAGLLKAFGFEEGAAAKGAKRSFSHLDISKPFVLVNRSRNTDYVKKDLHRGIVDACNLVLANEKATRTELVKWTEFVYTNEFPELRFEVEITKSMPEAVANQRRADANTQLDAYKDKYRDFIDQWALDLDINITRIPSMSLAILTAEEANISEESDYSTLSADQLLEKLSAFGERVEEILMAREGKLATFERMGGEVLDKKAGEISLRKPNGASGKRTFNVETFGSADFLTSAAERQIDSALKAISKSTERRIEALKSAAAEKREAPAGDGDSTPLVDGTILSRTVLGNKLPVKALEAKQRVYDTLVMASGLESQELFDILPSELKIKDYVVGQYFDPEKTDRPQPQNQTRLAAFRRNVVEFVSEQLEAKSGEDKLQPAALKRTLTKLDKDFSSVSRERNRDTDLEVGEHKTISGKG